VSLEGAPQALGRRAARRCAPSKAWSALLNSTVEYEDVESAARSRKVASTA